MMGSPRPPCGHASSQSSPPSRRPAHRGREGPRRVGQPHPQAVCARPRASQALARAEEPGAWEEVGRGRPGPGPWGGPRPARTRHSPDSLLMSLAASLGAAGTLRLAFCSLQCSRQCRSWEWMKRHMSQAWAAHTRSSMHSLWAEGSVGSGCTCPGQGAGQDPAVPGPPPPPGRAWPVPGSAPVPQGGRRDQREEVTDVGPAPVTPPHACWTHSAEHGPCKPRVRRKDSSELNYNAAEIILEVRLLTRRAT